MARFYGFVGFIETVDDGTGIWEPRETVRPYYGDVGNDVRRWDAKQQATNDDLQLNNNISILADQFAYENLSAMKWVEWNGVKWRITSAEVEWPRITLHFGGVWNGPSDQS